MVRPFDYVEKSHKCFRCTVTLPDDPADGMTLLDWPEVCRCFIRAIGSDPALAEFGTMQNYAARAPGSSLAVEAELQLTSPEHPDWTRLRIGIPLSELGAPVRELELTYTGPRFRLSANGKVLDEECPFGDPPGDPPPEFVIEPAKELPPEPQELTEPLHLWSPPGLNAWAGDVSVGYFNGEYHLFYLYDRKHHYSSFWAGSHTWHHLVSRDLKNWRNDGEILPHEAQYISYGTGTPFMFDGRIFLTYGLHTGRYLPPGTAPRGATWAESTDGCRFTPSRKIFHRSENPSVLNGEGGELLFFAGFGREEMQLLRSRNFPEMEPEAVAVFPLEEKSATGHTAECPAYFHWHGKHYLLVGFSGFYSADTPDFAKFRDLAAEGRDLYDGLEVPMVAPFTGDRRILAGWLRMDGLWGGVLGLRELVWCEDGIPGIRWLEETMPGHGRWAALPENGKVESCCYLQTRCEPGKAVNIRLSGEGEDIEIRLFAEEKKAELVLASVHDYPVIPAFPSRRKPGGCAAGNLRGIDEPYTLRVLIRYDRKWQGSIVDVEIAGMRTLIHHFPGHRTRQVLADTVLQTAPC